MGTSLTGVKIKDSYDAIIKVSDNGALDGTLQVLTDGLGNDSALSLSTAGASVGGTLSVSGNAAFDTNTLFVDAANNRVGIGTDLPTEQLHISGADNKILIESTNFAALQLKSGTTRTFNITSIDTASGALIIYDATAGSERMRVHSGGDISFRDSSANEAFYWDASAASLGIGTATIDAKLQVAGNISLGRYNVGSSRWIGISNGGGGFGDSSGANIEFTASGGVNDMRFYTYSGSAYAERMRIDSSGNVGIGTSVPQFSLALKQDSKVGWNDAGSAKRGSITVNSSADAMVFATGTSDTERMRITSGGYLKASNTGSYYESAGAAHEVNSNQSREVFGVFNTAASSPYGQYTEFSSASPNNSTNYFLSCADSSASRVVLRSNGGIANYQANDVNLSDERVKTDISPLGSYWDKIKGIEIVNFKYKDQTHDDFNIGVIAQQVESVAPEFVDIDGFDNRPKLISEEVLDEEGNVIEEAVYEEPLAEPLKAVYTADLYHAAIKVLQEAMARIEVLETELNALKQA